MTDTLSVREIQAVGGRGHQPLQEPWGAPQKPTGRVPGMFVLRAQNPSWGLLHRDVDSEGQTVAVVTQQCLCAAG